jgi:hypothetical protein
MPHCAGPPGPAVAMRLRLHGDDTAMVLARYQRFELMRELVRLVSATIALRLRGRVVRIGRERVLRR